MAAGPRRDDLDTTRIYVAGQIPTSTLAPVDLVWSDDLGESWSAPIEVGDLIVRLPRIGPEGELYIAGRGVDNTLELARSFDIDDELTDDPPIMETQATVHAPTHLFGPDWIPGAFMSSSISASRSIPMTASGSSPSGRIERVPQAAR